MANIRTFLNLLVVIFMASLNSSCNNDDSMLHDETNVKLTLNLGKQTPLATRATDNGIDALNENLINNVDLFFYKIDAEDTDEPIYYTTDMVLPPNTKGSAQIDISMPKNKYNELFLTDADTECLVYAIVNRPSSTSGDNALPADKSLGSLKENTILFAEKFAEIDEDAETHFYRPSIQDNFVMDGSAVITRSGSELTGSIAVERVAAKISLYIDGIAPEVVDDQNVTWLSDINSVRLSLRRASKRTKLGSTPTEYIYGADNGNDIFSLNAISLDHSVNGSMTTSVPFYTYPTNWTNDENSRTHFILVVEWIKKEGADRLMTFYEVNVNAAGSYTERNHHYVIKQEISVLGSTNEENPKELYHNNYIVLDWGNAMNDDNDKTDSDAELSRFKYLMVNETKIEMDNTVSDQINFFSSAPIYLTSATIGWEHTANELSETLTMANQTHVTKTLNAQGDTIYTFYNNNAVDGIPNRIVGNDNNPNQDYRVKITIHNADPEDKNDLAYINVEHKLNNEMVETADFTQYYIDFTVQHQNDNTYNETISITQYPMIFIRTDRNYDSYNGGDRNGDKGFVYVNAGQEYSQFNAQWYSVSGMSFNTNPNRYIISVSSLTADADTYMIGDPRSKTPQNPSESAINADSEGKKLTQYRPTLSNGTEDMLSPQFMVASSYGNCPKSNMSRDEAERRCATYQEDGYLAGRWRIPTRAEIEYIAQLYAWEKIPPLFSSGMSYWSAQGCIQVNNNKQVVSSTSTTGLVRCVYDTWYWGTGQENRTQYVYGDVRE